MQFRVDTDGMTFIVGGIRGVMDFETKVPVLDKSSGVPLFDERVEGAAEEQVHEVRSQHRRTRRLHAHDRHAAGGKRREHLQ